MSNILDMCCAEMPSRHNNLKKYFPFFELMRLNNGSAKYKEYDMSTLGLAIIEFLLMEGKLKEKGIHFNDIEEYLKNFIYEVYNKELDHEELRELTRYVMLKLQNDGEPFKYEFYDTNKKIMVEETLRYVTLKPSYKSNNEFLYHLTSEGVEFFLQTKEFGDESKVTIYLLLLQKQLRSNDFENVYNTVVNLNTEVQKQIDRKKEISESLIYARLDSFSKYIEYSDKSIGLLSEEKEMFATTYNTVKTIREEYIKKAAINISEMKDKEKENIQYLWNTDKELSLTIDKHSRLLKELVSLKKEIIEIRNERRRKVFKKSFDFERFLYDAMKTNNTFSLKAILEPLLDLRVNKELSPEKIELMFTKKSNKRVDEIIEEDVATEINAVVPLNDLAEQRIYKNFRTYFIVLLEVLCNFNECDLVKLIDEVKSKYGEFAVSHPDFLSFVMALYSRKDLGKDFAHFNYREILEKGNTATKIEKLYKEIIEDNDEFSFFKYITLDIEFIQDSTIEISEGFTLTNFTYKR